MKIVDAKATLMKVPKTTEEVRKHIELCGRVCYKSEGKITDDSASGFVKRLISRGHEAVLEHGVIVMEISKRAYRKWIIKMNKYAAKHGRALYIRSTASADGVYIVSGNVRAWRDALRFCIECTGVVCDNPAGLFVPEDVLEILGSYQPLFDDLLLLVKMLPCKGREAWDLHGATVPCKRGVYTIDEIKAHFYRTVWSVCDRGVSHEIVRHRPSGFCQESTRYCNYAKGDFGGEITVVRPTFFKEDSMQYRTWEWACRVAETAYFRLLNNDASPQQARTVLPNSLKTEVVMTTNVEEWVHFIKLRCDAAAHPQMREVATHAKEALLSDIPEMEALL